MEIKAREDDFLLVVSAHEARVLSGALNETLEAVEHWEFHSRLGAEEGEVRELHDALHAALSAAS